jgi:mannosyltransferase OCH1-like enzyme
MTIPNIFHQIWFNFKQPGVDSIVPLHYAKFQSDWKLLHPNAIFYTWNDSNARDLVKSNFPWFLQTYDNYKAPIYRVDAFRVMALYCFGGIYADMDLKCKKSLHDIILSDIRMDVGLIRVNKAFLTNWFMCSVPRHDFLLHILQTMKNRQKNFLLHRRTTGLGPMWCTGPLLIDAAYNSFRGDKKNFNVMDDKGIISQYLHHDKHATWFKADYILQDILIIISPILLLILLIVMLKLFFYEAKSFKKSTNSLEFIPKEDKKIS